MFDFPNAPTLNQVFIDPTSGVSYRWDGAAWRGGPIDQGASVPIISDTPPAASIPGQLWFESDTGNLFILYADVDFDAVGAAQLLAGGDQLRRQVGRHHERQSRHRSADGRRRADSRQAAAVGKTTPSLAGRVASTAGRQSSAILPPKAAAAPAPTSRLTVTTTPEPTLTLPSSSPATPASSPPTSRSRRAFAHRSARARPPSSTNVWTKVNIATLGLNVGGWAVSGNNLIVPKNGVYLIGASLIITAAATAVGASGRHRHQQSVQQQASRPAS